MKTRLWSLFCRSILWMMGLVLLCLPTSVSAQSGLKVEFDRAKSAPKTTGMINLVGTEIRVSDQEPDLVKIAAQDLALDIESVSGAKPRLIFANQHTNGTRQIWIASLDQAKDLSALVKSEDLDRLKNCVECFFITVVDHPKSGVDQALVIIGSDRRGTAFGVYEVSRAIGVSPWVWWADIAPKTHKQIWLKSEGGHFGPPSIGYRGIFINDEDWGLLPWAAKNFDSQTQNIGPKTYEKVFGLLLRLKANTLWPAMHKVSKPFNADPENARLADQYGIIMGSSHAEPMLRNNVGEWTLKPEDYNFATHAPEVTDYWRQRLITNGRYDNIYTLGMRGIHDSGIVGAKTVAEKQALLNQILKTQRQLIADTVGDPKTVPQVFVPYKEVLEIYREGLDLPEDVSLMWPDDNFGYIRQFPNAQEQARSGGNGLYYHLSYLGAPLSYIWLSTTPIDLLKEELGRAYDHQMRRMWIFNVGDIKPAEVNISYVFDLAWDIEKIRPMSQKAYLRRFGEESFGQRAGDGFATLMDGFYGLSYERRPEHLQFYYGRGAKPRLSPWSAAKIDARLQAFATLSDHANNWQNKLAPELKDAGFQLLNYPIMASNLANIRAFGAECAWGQKPCRLGGLDHAKQADQDLKVLNARYDGLRGGKWAGFMSPEPADKQWPSFRIKALDLDKKPDGLDIPKAVTDQALWPKKADGWQEIKGLGQDGHPALKAVTDQALTLWVPQKSDQETVLIGIVPQFAHTADRTWRLEVQINDQLPFVLNYGFEAGDAFWSEAVLQNSLLQNLPPTPKGLWRLKLKALDEGVILNKIVLRSPEHLY